MLSELVTNAVLHGAGRELHVRLHLDAAGQRLEVEDGYAGLPRPREVTGSAVGHGLHLLQTLSSAWGVQPLSGGGKVVWAQFGAGVARGEAPAPEPAVAVRAAAERFSEGASAGPELDVRVLRLPLALFAAQLTSHRTLMRELTLVARAPSPEDPPELVELARELSRYGAMGEATEGVRAAALAAGRDVLDLTYRLPVTAGRACHRMLALLGAADGYARAGALLVLPTPPLQVQVREWFLCQIVEQCQGAPARPWDGPRHT